MSKRRKAPADRPSSVVVTAEWRKSVRDWLAADDQRYADLCGPVTVRRVSDTPGQ